MHKFKARTIFLLLAAAAWIASPVYSYLAADAAEMTAAAACPSGRSTARLTGWLLNNKRPIGTATYDEKAQRLEVSVESVGLADGEQLTVFAGDDRIGQIDGLKSGAAKAVLTRALEDGAMVAVWDGDRPVVSGSLVCAEPPAQTPTPTATPSPTAIPTVTPAPSPTPTVTPPPTPTASPMPSPTL